MRGSFQVNRRVSEQTRERPLRVGSFVVGRHNSQWPGSGGEEGGWRARQEQWKHWAEGLGHRDVAGGARQGGCRGARLRIGERGAEKRERLKCARLRWEPHSVTGRLGETDGLQAVFREGFQRSQFC